MKNAKLYLLPVAALMALGACADAEREIPEDPDADTVLDVTSDTPESVQNYTPVPETGEMDAADGDAMEDSEMTDTMDTME